MSFNPLFSPSFTAGAVAFESSAGSLQVDGTHLFWDQTNKGLAINAAALSNSADKLYVNGDVKLNSYRLNAASGFVSDSSIGTFNIAGASVNSGTAGSVEIKGGDATGASNIPGSVTMQGGGSLGSAQGGGFFLFGGASTTGTGGFAQLIGGGSGSGAGGDVYIIAGTGGTNGTGHLQDGNSFDMITWKDNAMGFFQATPIAQPTVTGLKGGNAALGSLCTALANLGLIINSTGI